MQDEEKTIYSIEERIFVNKTPNWPILEAFGFSKEGDIYRYSALFMDDDFRADIWIDADGHVHGEVIDMMTEEEFLPMRAMAQTGSFVSSVRYAYEELLNKLADACFTALPFISDQANRLVRYIRDKYDDKLEFPWSGANEGCGIFRHQHNQKWYGLIMRIPLSKLEKDEADKEKQVDVLNLKIDPEQGERLHSEKGIYPAWHMNHKSWISVRLDEVVADERIHALLADSYALTDQRTHGRKGNEKKIWIVPAHPKYYDVISDFNANDYSDWKQGKGIEVGDIVYLYVGAPYSAIMYRMEVMKTHIPYHGETAEEVTVKELMDVHILDRYPADLCTRKGMMTANGVTSVRGPRFMPQPLIDAIEHAQKRS